MLVANTMKSNTPEANQIVIDKVSNSQTMGPGTITLGVVMLTVTGIDPERELLIDQVVQGTGPQVDKGLRADTGYMVLTLEIIEMRM